MQLVFEASRTGLPTCKAEGLYLHSSYDPEREAEAFLGRSLAPGPASAFVLLGPGLDYLSPLLRKRYAKHPIIRIQYDPALAGHEVAGSLAAAGPATWYPGRSGDLGDFLAAELGDDGLAGLRILEWEASARLWPSQAQEARKAVKAALDGLASEAATLKVFGRPWLRNACRNFLLAESLVEARATTGLAVVAAAGPSLEEDLAVLQRLKGRYLLVAVSSALACLRARGLEPDLVVSTDGGFWSRHHLYPGAAKPLTVAASLSTLASASLARSTSLLPLIQAGFPETELGAGLGTGLGIKPQATVSGTALALAGALTDGPVVAMGLDLASLDILSHGRPHGFDHLSRDVQSRLGGLESLAYARERPLAPLALAGGRWRTSRSLELYAGALARLGLRGPLAGRLFRLRPSPVSLEGFRDLDEGGLEELASGYPAPAWEPRPVKGPSYDERRQFLGDCLASWAAAVDLGVHELEAGRFPGPREREILKTLDLVDYAAAHRALLDEEDGREGARILGARARGYLADLHGRLL